MGPTVDPRWPGEDRFRQGMQGKAKVGCQWLEVVDKEWDSGPGEQGRLTTCEGDGFREPPLRPASSRGLSAFRGNQGRVKTSDGLSVCLGCSQIPTASQQRHGERVHGADPTSTHVWDSEALSWVARRAWSSWKRVRSCGEGESPAVRARCCWWPEWCPRGRSPPLLCVRADSAGRADLVGAGLRLVRCRQVVLEYELPTCTCHPRKAPRAALDRGPMSVCGRPELRLDTAWTQDQLSLAAAGNSAEGLQGPGRNWTSVLAKRHSEA